MRDGILMSAFLIVCASMVTVAQSPFELRGIRSGLARSPDDFVAGVFESIGSIQCEAQDNGGQLCWSRVLVVDEMISRPTSKSPRLQLKLAAGGKPGEVITGRLIGFLVPIKGTDVYSGSYMTGYGPNKHQRFRHLVETALTGERSL